MDMFGVNASGMMTVKSDAEGSAEPDSNGSSKKKGSEPPKPPSTYEEFLHLEQLTEWPVRLTSENKLDLSEEKQLLGDPEKFASKLKEATPVNSERLAALEHRLETFNNALFSVTEKMLANVDDIADPEVPPSSPRKDSFPLSVKKGYLAEKPKSDALATHPSQKKKPINFKDKVLESQKRTVEQCEFPGFRSGELTELPGSLEAPQILHRVTKAQDFNNCDKENADPGFRKFWKKIFQSEASIAMMQDSFWWTFIELFQRGKKKRQTDQSRLFDRMSDSFVALFSSIDADLKDKVFAEYPNCLAQALFAAYWEAFPESQRLFADMFRQYLCNITMEWVSGMKATPGVFEGWNVKELEPKLQRDSKDAIESSEFSMPTIAQQNSGGAMEPYDYLMNEFFAVLESLGGEKFDEMYSLDREPTKLTAILDKPPSKSLPESSVMGKGPEMHRSLFDLEGKSPLVTHYLRLRRVHAANSSTNVKVHRTEIVRQPSPDQPTYRDLINETKAASQTLSKEYGRVCDMTSKEIMRIEKNTRETNRKIEKLQRELLFCKNSLEVKLMGEKVLNKSEPVDTKLALQDDSDDDESDILM